MGRSTLIIRWLPIKANIRAKLQKKVIDFLIGDRDLEGNNLAVSFQFKLQLLMLLFGNIADL